MSGIGLTIAELEVGSCRPHWPHPPLHRVHRRHASSVSLSIVFTALIMFRNCCNRNVTGVFCLCTELLSHVPRVNCFLMCTELKKLSAYKWFKNSHFTLPVCTNSLQMSSEKQWKSAEKIGDFIPFPTEITNSLFQQQWIPTDQSSFKSMLEQDLSHTQLLSSSRSWVGRGISTQNWKFVVVEV